MVSRGYNQPYHLPEDSVKNSPLSRIFLWISSFFPKLMGHKTSMEVSQHIENRVQLLQKIAHKVLDRLEKETERLKNECNGDEVGEIVPYLVRAVQPIMNKADTLAKSSTQQSGIQQVEALEDLIFKADIYTRLISSRKFTSKGKVQALFNQWIHDRIELDLNVIRRYQDHRVAELHLSEDKKKVLIQKIEGQLSRLGKSLERLPANVSIEEIERKRDEYTNLAYHVIDEATAVGETENQDLAIVDLRECAILEEEVSLLIEDIEKSRHSGRFPVERERLISELSRLEEMVKEEVKDLREWNPEMKKDFQKLEDRLELAWEAVLTD